MNTLHCEYNTNDYLSDIKLHDTDRPPNWDNFVYVPLSIVFIPRDQMHRIYMWVIPKTFDASRLSLATRQIQYGNYLTVVLLHRDN